MNQRPFTRLHRRRFLQGGAALLASGGIVLSATGSRAQGTEITIGHQKGSANLLVLKARGELAAKLEPLGFTVNWAEFTSGPPLLEALNAGSIVFGATGAPPPIFAQAAGTDLVYAIASKPSPLTSAIVVAAESPLSEAADLAGKKVAVAKGSSAHAQLVRAVRFAGLEWADVEPIYLQPADAKAAFEGGSVDAWAIWDPYYGLAEADSGARTLLTNETLGVLEGSFYLAARSFIEEQFDALKIIADALTETDAWAGDHPVEVAELLSGETGIPTEVLVPVEERREYGLIPVTPELIAAQQDLADIFFELELIPEQLDVSAAFLPQVFDLVPAAT